MSGHQFMNGSAAITINWPALSQSQYSTFLRHKIIVNYLLFHRSTPDAHTTADVDYRWKGGKSQGVEIVSKEMAQFDFVGAKTTTKANTNSKGMTF